MNGGVQNREGWSITQSVRLVREFSPSVCKDDDRRTKAVRPLLRFVVSSLSLDFLALSLLHHFSHISCPASRFVSCHLRLRLCNTVTLHFPFLLPPSL
jgi:hypothetical protein